MTSFPKSRQIPERFPATAFATKLATLCTAVLSLVVIFGSSLSVKAAELVMLEQEYCAWCERWDAEIGPIYPKAWESKVAPLRKVDIHDTMPADLKDMAPGAFTPTFVLMHDGREIGRLRGYAGEDFFWPLLDELLQKLPETVKSGVAELKAAAS